MATRLIQIVPFTNVGAGAQATLAHSLNIQDRAITPDWVFLDNTNFSVAATTSTTITVQNNGSAAGNCNVWVERRHSTPRALGDVATVALTPQPFVAATGAASGSATNLTTTYYVPGTSRVTRYLRPGGDNANDGLTPATAWAGNASGLIQALEWLSVASYNQIQVIDITGCSINVPTQLNLGSVNLGTYVPGYDFNGTLVNGQFSNATCQIIAELEQVQPVTIVGAAAAPTSGLYTITVSETLVPNAHRGQFLVEAGLGNSATIRENGVNTITVCTRINPQTWTAPAIYGPGATLTTGDAVDFFSQGIYLQANTSWFFHGIDFRVNRAGASALSMIGDGPFPHVSCCQLPGMDWGGSGGTFYGQMWSCYVYDEVVGMNNASFNFQNSYFRGVEWICHRSGQYGDLSECVIENHVQPFGGGVSNPEFMFAALYCEFRGGAAGGVRVAYGNSRMTNCVVADNTGAGISVGPNAFLTLVNVDGTGNTTYGISITNGSQVDVDAGTSVTGTLNDIFLGGSGGIPYASVPANDLASGTPQLVRIF